MRFSIKAYELFIGRVFLNIVVKINHIIAWLDLRRFTQLYRGTIEKLIRMDAVISSGYILTKYVGKR